MLEIIKSFFSPVGGGEQASLHRMEIYKGSNFLTKITMGRRICVKSIITLQAIPTSIEREVEVS